MRFSGRNRQTEPGFQLAPMIDVMFILLSFFIASQIFARWEKEINIQLPTATTGIMPQRLPGEIIINIRQDGTFVVNEQTFSGSGLESLLGRIVEMFPGQPVLIRADRKTEYQHIIAALDLCRQSDIWNISFATAVSD